MTMREGFRAGWAHWGVLMRIALLYVAATVGSLVLLATPSAIALLTIGPIGGVIVGISTLLVAVHGLKLMVATFAGTLVIGVVGAVAIVPVVLSLITLLPVLPVLPLIVAGCVLLVPAIYVVIAMIGTLRSSIWPIGYVTQVEP